MTAQLGLARGIAMLRLGSFLCSFASLASAQTTVPNSAVSDFDAGRLLLSWRSSPPCGDARTVAQWVNDLIGDQTYERKAQAQLDVTAKGSGYRVALQFTQGERKGHRSFDAESCAAALDASTLVLAVALEPTMQWDAALSRLAQLRRSPDGEQDAQAPAEPPAPPKSSPELTQIEQPIPVSAPEKAPGADTARPRANGRRASPHDSTQPARVHLAARALIDTATLPSWSGGLMTAIGLDCGQWYLEAAGLMLLPRNASVPGAAKRGASVQLLGGETRICRDSASASSSFTARPCAGAMVAAVAGNAFGLGSRHEVEPYVAATLGAEVALRVTRNTSTTAGIAVVVPLRSVSVVVDGVDSALHRTATALQLRVGLDWAL